MFGAMYSTATAIANSDLNREKRLGDKIKELRVYNEMNQLQLAEKLGVSQSFVSQVERNIRIPSNKKIKLILDIFSIKSEHLSYDVIESKKTKLNRMIDRLSEKNIDLLLNIVEQIND